MNDTRAIGSLNNLPPACCGTKLYSATHLAAVRGFHAFPLPRVAPLPVVQSYCVSLLVNGASLDASFTFNTSLPGITDEQVHHLVDRPRRFAAVRLLLDQPNIPHYNRRIETGAIVFGTQQTGSINQHGALIELNITALDPVIDAIPATDQLLEFAV